MVYNVSPPKTFAEVVIDQSPVRIKAKEFFSLSFKIFYETIPGESLCVVGSIPELGAWKTYKCHMTWTEGHIWVLEKPIITSEPYFFYKYVLMGNET